MALSSVNGREVVSDAFAAAVTAISLHTASPGAAGTTAEVTGGNPAYARKAPVVGDFGVDGSSTLTATFDLPAGVTASHYGLWASSTFLDGQALQAAVSQSPQGQVTVTVQVVAS